jgi:hypothetical protein
MSGAMQETAPAAASAMIFLKYAQEVAVTASVFPPELALCFLCGGSSAQRLELAGLAQAWG